MGMESSPEQAGCHDWRAATNPRLIQAQLRGGWRPHCSLMKQPEHLQVASFCADSAP